MLTCCQEHKKLNLLVTNYLLFARLQLSDALHLTLDTTLRLQLPA